MTEITEHEFIMRFCDGLKMASDAARQLGVIQRNSDFLGISRIIEEIAQNGKRLAMSKAMKKIELQGGLQKFSAVMGNEQPN